MNINFSEFNEIPALRAKKDTLDKAVEAESEVIQVAFRQNRNEALAIIERIDKAYDETRVYGVHHETQKWYGSYYTYISYYTFIIAGMLITFIGPLKFFTLGMSIITIGVGLYFRNLIIDNNYKRKDDDAMCALDMLGFRLQSLSTCSTTIYFYVLHKEEKRLDALTPIPDRSAYLEVWSHMANEWLNTERSILNAITQRHSIHDRDWKNELDKSWDDYMDKIKTTRG